MIPMWLQIARLKISVLTPEAIHTGTSGYVNRCLGGPTPGLASLERPQQVPQR